MPKISPRLLSAVAVTALALTAAGFLAAGNTKREADAAPAIGQKTSKPAAAQKRKTVPVERVGVPTVVKLPGRLAGFQEVSIFPKVNGYVRKVLVDIGSK